MNPIAMLLTDGYKTGHHKMYPKGTTLVYSNFTPRSNKYAPNGATEIVNFGQQMVMRQIHEMFHNFFFSLPEEEVCTQLEEEFSMYLGAPYDVSHFRALHQLGYLPIEVKALPEGHLVPIGVPVLTIKNTHPDFFWITNYLETLLSNLLWKPMVAASIAYEFRKLFDKYAEMTNPAAMGFVPFQGHDFSMRGMDSVGAVISSGLGHAVSFMGSDSLPVIYGARQYYDHPDDEPVIMSVNATEHSVMSSGTGLYGEFNTFKQLIKDFPSGILSVVSDTFDLWKVLTEYLPALKSEILARDGKLVIRPDSGNPVDIICGEIPAGGGGANHPRDLSHPKYKGVVEILWDLFGGETNPQGYKVLHESVGVIYGDAITLERAEQICQRLEAKGFASTNVVMGVGSLTYQYNTRDTFGFAMKATYCEVAINEAPPEDQPEYHVHKLNIFKDPVTDDGRKKSLRGLLRVYHLNGKYEVFDEQPSDFSGELKVIYQDGKLENQVTFNVIRQRLHPASIEA